MQWQNNGVNHPRSEDMKECILLCQECKNILKPEDVIKDGRWGHVCREKKFRREHRCESYVETYEKKEPQ